jgi:hypothetical protein
MRYKKAQKIDPWPGENYSGTSVLAGIKVCQKEGWFDSYRWAFGADEMLMGLSYDGPAVLGTKVYQGMAKPGPDGRMKLTGRKLGGHCWLWNQIDVANGRVWCVNSWGPSWGVGGRAFLTFHDLDRLLKRGGEVAFMVGRKTRLR